MVHISATVCKLLLYERSDRKSVFTPDKLVNCFWFDSCLVQSSLRSQHFDQFLIPLIWWKCLIAFLCHLAHIWTVRLEYFCVAMTIGKSPAIHLRQRWQIRRELSPLPFPSLSCAILCWCSHYTVGRGKKSVQGAEAVSRALLGFQLSLRGRERMLFTFRHQNSSVCRTLHNTEHCLFFCFYFSEESI